MALLAKVMIILAITATCFSKIEGYNSDSDNDRAPKKSKPEIDENFKDKLLARGYGEDEIKLADEITGKDYTEARKLLRLTDVKSVVKSLEKHAKFVRGRIIDGFQHAIRDPFRALEIIIGNDIERFAPSDEDIDKVTKSFPVHGNADESDYLEKNAMVNSFVALMMTMTAKRENQVKNAIILLGDSDALSENEKFLELKANVFRFLQLGFPLRLVSWALNGGMESIKNGAMLLAMLLYVQPPKRQEDFLRHKTGIKRGGNRLLPLFENYVHKAVEYLTEDHLVAARKAFKLTDCLSLLQAHRFQDSYELWVKLSDLALRMANLNCRKAMRIMMDDGFLEPTEATKRKLITSRKLKKYKLSYNSAWICLVAAKNIFVKAEYFCGDPYVVEEFLNKRTHMSKIDKAFALRLYSSDPEMSMEFYLDGEQEEKETSEEEVEETAV